ncbi:MAG: hypothetical protein LBT27_07525 [Prevotellaceae bacterium]|nr:hypothetical protein [Prevotellaceae bacterium]
MKKLNYLLIGLFLAVAFSSCKNDNDDPPVTPAFNPPTSAEFTGIRQNFLDGLMQIKTFDATTELPFVFTSPKGVVVTIGYAAHQGGLPVTGNVQLRYAELFDIGTMALANKPLMGKDNSGNAMPLVTGGEFFIEVTQNGEKLYGNANLEVPVSYTQGANPADMTLWGLDEDSNVWDENMDGNMGMEANGSANASYYCWLPFCWANIDWLYSLPGVQTALRVKVPDGYNADNCSVYAAYLTMPNTIAPFDIYDATGKYFTEHTGIAPIGYQMFVIFISEDPLTEQFLYATKLVTVAANQYVTFTSDDLHTGSTQQIIDAINGLYN